jgi:hypothetical protein
VKKSERQEILSAIGERNFDIFFSRSSVVQVRECFGFYYFIEAMFIKLKKTSTKN